MHRRRFILAASAGFLGLPTTIRAQPRFEPTIVPAPSTPAATPAPDLPRFEGELRQIWVEPWEVEGRLLTFKGVIMQREVAPPGSAIAVGEDRDAFRSLIHLYVPLGDGTANWLFVASRSDLGEIQECKTAEVTGTYGGLYYPDSTQPLIIAAKIEPAAP